MKAWKNWALACLLACASAGTLAQTFTGQITYHNDVAYHEFTLTESSGVQVWTDSFQNGLNFDPIVSVWLNGVLMGYDDDGVVMPGQTSFDSFLSLSLDAGTYLVAVSRFSNFPKGSTLSEGFLMDSATPSLLAGGRDYRVHVTLGDYIPPVQVPEPGSWAMLLGGLGLLLARRRGAKA